MKKFAPALFTILTILIFSMNSFADIYPRTDTLFISETTELPAIDGDAADAVWETVEWAPIDQVWMPWGNDASNLDQEDGLEIYDGEEDFTGNFKVVWSAETDLLYFLVQTTDDVFVDGYVFPDGGYPNYDIVEIFIDEDRSGGLHVFDGTGSTGEDWGTNAENAFSYHIAADALADGETQDQFVVVDIAGTSWSDRQTPDYASHFPEFIMKKTGNTYTWEFSLQVHDDTYIPEDEAQSMVDLEMDKIFGLTLAYCDNDDPGHIQREHFFGSVFVPEANYNDHWMQADFYGVAKLAEAQTAGLDFNSNNHSGIIKAWENNNQLHIQYLSNEIGAFDLSVTDLSGREIMTRTFDKSNTKWSGHIVSDDLRQGIYIISISQNNYKTTQKIIIR